MKIPVGNFTQMFNFTQALGLIIRSADGVLRRARNLCVSTLLEAVRSRTKTVDLKIVNKVLIQPHWRKDFDLASFN